jgi:arylsulfatase A-like enzyme
MRAPGFVHSPLLPVGRRGAVHDGLMHVSDWYPTLLALAGRGDEGLGLDGFNQVGLVCHDY